MIRNLRTILFLLVAFFSLSSGSHVAFYGMDGTVTETESLIAENLPYGEITGGVNYQSRYIYTAKEWVPELAMYYFGQRYYDPVLGSWNARDPIKQYHSPYIFVNNNPLNVFDPDGKQGYFTPESFIPAGVEVREKIALAYVEAAGTAAWFVDQWFLHVFGEGWSDVAGAGGTIKTFKGLKGLVNKKNADNLLNDATEDVATKTSKNLDETNVIQKTDTKKTHGNTLNDKPAEGYTLRDRDGNVQKYGETTRGEDKFGQGKQKRYTKKYLKENKLDYQKEKSGTKKEMHKWQHEKILEYKDLHGGTRPPLNKSDY